MTSRPRLSPAMADARRAVRELLESMKLGPNDLVLAAVSGGGDSIALAAALAFEAPRLNLRAGAVIIDHGLQENSEAIATEAAKTSKSLGLEPVVVRRVTIEHSGQGLEAAARDARYEAIEQVREETAAVWVLLGHNLEDQAESVLLGLTRGSGLRSIAGMQSVDSERKLLRPFLELTREALRTSCQDQGLSYWDDPHNEDPKFTRVRIRQLIKNLEADLGPGLAQALSRTAAVAAEAEEYLSAEAQELISKAKQGSTARTFSLSIAALAEAPVAVRNKALVLLAQQVGARAVTRSQVLGIAELISNWHGQKMVQLSGITVEREGELLVFKTTKSLNPGAC